MSVNLELHIRLICQWCGYINHETIPIIGRDTDVNYKCEHCKKYIFNIHSSEIEE